MALGASSRLELGALAPALVERRPELLLVDTHFIQLVVGEACRTLPCMHHYHGKCIDRWVESAYTAAVPVRCPLCNVVMAEHVEEPRCMEPAESTRLSAATHNSAMMV